MPFLAALLFASALALPAHAASVPPPAQPLTEETVDAPQVTIVKKDGMVLEEYRIAGKLYMIKVTPKVGKPYYLVDERGDGKFSRQESLDSGFRPPRWVLFQF